MSKKESTPKKSKSRHPAIFKKKVVEEYRMGIFTEAELCEKYELEAKQLRAWNRWYQHTYLNPFYQQKMQKKAEEEATITQLKKELAATHKRLEAAELRVTLLEKLIRVSEKALGISLKKNFGDKPFPK